MSDNIFEVETGQDLEDPNERKIKDFKLYTHPMDINIETITIQIKDGLIHVRPINAKPRFQRKYVWPDTTASQLIESLLLNVPIPPIYLAEDDEAEHDVIDGQQRIYTLYRFFDNQFKLTGLKILNELNGIKYFEMDSKLRTKLRKKTLRCIVISNDSDPDLKFEVFERLNSNTVPLNAQELRNCVYRGPFNYLLHDLSEYKPWLKILGRRDPDKRLRDEEMILRYFSFQILGIDKYFTPQKFWLNKTAETGSQINEIEANELAQRWKETIQKCYTVFEPNECFRRSVNPLKKTAVNKAIMDLVLYSFSDTPADVLFAKRENIRNALYSLLDDQTVVFNDDDFSGLVSRSVDHVRRVNKRFEIWQRAFNRAIA